MTAFGDSAVPRKRLTTYGKAVRRRIPEYSFTSLGRRSKTPDVERENDLLSSASIARGDDRTLKAIYQRSESGPSSPALPVDANVFDIPSSDDDTAPKTPRPIHKTAQKSIHNRIPKIMSTKEIPAPPIDDIERRKRIKLSPESNQKHKLKVMAWQPMPNATAEPKNNQTIFGTGEASTASARPKLEIRQGKLDAQRTPQRIVKGQRKILQHNTPSPSTSDLDMLEAEDAASFMSPRGLQMWKGILESAGEQDVDGIAEKGGQLMRTARTTAEARAGSVSHTSGNALHKSAGVFKHRQRSVRKLPRRRLIDSLVEQTIDRDDTEENDSGSDDPEFAPKKSPTLNASSIDTDISRSQSLAPEVRNPSTVASTSQGSQNAGVKFTYSRQRSMLAEQDLMKQLEIDIPSQSTQDSQTKNLRRGSIPTLPPLQNLHNDDETDEGATSTAIRSVHELRQAGANNRFLDEVEDLLDRIGNPTAPYSSMRRAGLLDLANKMRDKGFVRQFRANGIEQRLFLHLGQEVDLIAGFIMVSLLIAVLIDANMPHIVALLRRQGITRLLIRLIGVQGSIATLSKERSNNMSKVAQSLLADQHEFLLHLPLWEDLQPFSISPRTAALKCLELMVRQTRESGNSAEIISKELTTSLFKILKSAPDESSWVLPMGQHAIDFCLALSALESHSIAGKTSPGESIWVSDYLPIIADALEISLARPVDDFGVLQVLVLRLTLNVTNNDPIASDVFARPALMAAMGQAIVTKFSKISRFLTEEDLSIAVDHLILVLGVMINFAEWSLAARESLQSLHGKISDPLENLIQLFVDNQERTSEAESVEESQKNVAFGYLSVLLGYMALLPTISERVKNLQPRKTLRPLVAAIEEFIGHHRTVDDLIEADEDGHNPHTGLTERLESLVNNLGAVSGIPT